MKASLKKKQNRHAYALELKALIESRTGRECEAWLFPQIRAAAATEEMLDRIQDELLLPGNLIQMTIGSTGQQKNEMNPLLAQYDKMQRTLTLQLEALGLNYNTTPKKVTENTKQGGETNDPLVRFYKSAVEAKE